MELHQLRYAAAVADEGGFTRAAERLHVAQPGVSAQVRALERELGQELFDRGARGARPTAAGEALLPRIRAALGAVEAVRGVADELSGLLRGRVALGTVAGGGVGDMPRLLGGFHRAYPGVELRLVEAPTDELLAGLRGHDLDLVWLGVDAPLPDDVASETVLDVPIVAAVAPADPLARRAGVEAVAPADPPAARGTVTVAELAGRALITLPRGAGVRAAFERAAASAGVAVSPALEGAAPPLLADLAAQGLGVAIVPAPAVAGRDDVVTLALEPEIRSRIELAWRHDGPSSPAGRAMLEHVRARRADGQSGRTV